MANSPKPQQLKKPVPKYVMDRMAQFGAQINALIATQEQFLRDAQGLWGVDGSRFRVWWNFDDKNAKGEPAPTYEVLTIADHERRLRLQQAVQQAHQRAADPTPRKGEKPLALAKGTG